LLLKEKQKVFRKVSLAIVAVVVLSLMVAVPVALAGPGEKGGTGPGFSNPLF
jgi:hypothetical protein